MRVAAQPGHRAVCPSVLLVSPLSLGWCLCPPALYLLVHAAECQELLLQTTVPILRELIEKGEEEEACLELLSNILEVLYKAQKVNPVFSAGSFSHFSNCLGSDLTKPV